MKKVLAAGAILLAGWWLIQPSNMEVVEVVEELPVSSERDPVLVELEELRGVVDEQGKQIAALKSVTELQAAAVKSLSDLMADMELDTRAKEEEPKAKPQGSVHMYYNPNTRCGRCIQNSRRWQAAGNAIAGAVGFKASMSKFDGQITPTWVITMPDGEKITYAQKFGYLDVNKLQELINK